MAVTQSGGEPECICPIHGCDYEGSPASIEGHISSNTDENHKGEWGSKYREQIKGDVTGPVELEDPGVESGNIPDYGGSGGSSTDGDSDSVGDYDTESGGGPSPGEALASIPTSHLVAALAALAIVVIGYKVLFGGSGGSGGGSPDPSEDESDDSTVRREDGEGLLGEGSEK